MDESKKEGTQSLSNSEPPSSQSAPPTPSTSKSTEQTYASTLGPNPPNDQISNLLPTNTPNAQSREELVSRARAFLHSPQIQYQDSAAKQRFLAEKGLCDAEIHALLHESPSRAPVVPPRTYPQPPPSNLPTLLLGLARLFSWIGMGSIVLIFFYYRFLLPRIIQTSEARKALRSHHLSLMRRLTTSVASLKESHSESLAMLPRIQPYREPKEFAKCQSVTQVLKTLGEGERDYSSIPPVTLIRCTIADLSKGKRADEANPTTEEIFRLLEGKIPWLQSEDGYPFKKTLYETLSACPHFSEDGSPSTPAADEGPQETLNPSATWKYTAPAPPEPSPLVGSLAALNSAVPKVEYPRSSVFQHTLETLSDFTGYISSQVYLPYRPPPGGMGLSSSYGLSPAEEQLKKEIRALKGLVLNRKSFMPSIPRASAIGMRPTP